MYWTDWGGEAKIERASMDGSDRRVLHSTGLTWPNGLTIDYTAQRIYWADASRDMIEYSNIDGSGRFVLLSQLDHPFSITLEGDLLFWTDWLNQAIHVTHKILGTGQAVLYNNLRDRPFGIEAVTLDRQVQNSKYKILLLCQLMQVDFFHYQFSSFSLHFPFSLFHLLFNVQHNDTFLQFQILVMVILAHLCVF